MEETFREQFDVLVSALQVDNAYRQNALNLVASENQPSRAVRAAESILAGSCYSFSPPFEDKDAEWFFPSNDGLNQLMRRLSLTIGRHFHLKWVDPRPNGGSPCEHALALGLLKRGDTLMHVSHEGGGHFALEPICADAGIRVAHVEYDTRQLQIDPDATARKVRADPNVRLVMLDISFLLRNQPIKALRAALDRHAPDVLLAVDISHPMGLVLGGAFQNPAAEGADLVHGNTHKTFFGPQKGWIGFNPRSPRVDLERVVKPVCSKLCPQLQSNCSTGSMVAMLIAMEEGQRYGYSYAQQVLANAKALARHLSALGLQVVGESFGFTETHQVWVRIGSPDETLALVRDRLNPAGLRANNIQLPGERGAHGLRMGTALLTRRGLREPEMERVATFFKRIILDHDPVGQVRQDVADFLREYPLQRLAFCLPAADERALIEQCMFDILSN